MARPKKSDTDTASIVETEKKTIETENPVSEETTKEPEKAVETVEKTETEKSETETKQKKINDDDKIIIKCEKYAGKSIILPTRTIELDDNGKCEVTGLEAKRLLSIPGYELSK